MTADSTEGVWTYTMELARALRPSGAEILLAVMGPTLSPQQREEAFGLGHVALCEKPFALEWMKDPWRDVTQAGDWLLELEEQFHPDIVHLNHYCHGSLPWTAPVLISAHGCLLSWWQAVHGQQPPHSWSRYHAEVSAGLRGANLVVASTCAARDSLTRLYAPIPRLHQNAVRVPELRVIPHGCDPDGFRPMTKRDYVLSIGHPANDAQNLEMLDSVAQSLPWPVVLAGHDASAVERDNVLLHLTHHDVSTTDEMALKLGQAAVFASPTRYDPFGFDALHAALAGCALVLGDIPSLRETWGDAALFAPPDDPKTFAAVLHGVINDPALRREMAVRAKETALALTQCRLAEGILECYGRLVIQQTVPMEMDAR